MKGKSTYTADEIKLLEELIVLRNKADSSQQKGIRAKMRKLGFYGEDDWGIRDLQIHHLNTLIKSGRIKVSSNTIGDKPEIKTKKIVVHVETQPIRSSVSVGTWGLFDPLKDSHLKLPDEAGNYIICLRKGVQLPEVEVSPKHSQFEGLKVIYTGIASKSLRSRDYRQHFTGNNAGSSTLRKSIGSLFRFVKIPRDKDPSNGKTKFTLADEQKLSDWMRKNLVMFFNANDDYMSQEQKLIDSLNPPLNLKSNNQPENSDFRSLLSKLRK